VLMRDLSLGQVGPEALLNVLYLVVMCVVLLAVASRRFTRTLAK